jgi:membrane protease YdiL (CAAX protease family)
MAFYALAYVCSWSIAIPLALQATGVIEPYLPWSAHYVTAFAPAIAALIVTWACGRDMDLRPPAMPRDRRRTIIWCGVGLGSPLLLFEIARIVATVAGLDAPSWPSLGMVSFLPPLGLSAWVLWLVTSGVGEELGWRGFALPRLQETHSAFASSALLTLAWGGWHLPAFFYLPSYAAIGASIVPGFFVGLFAGSVVLTWLFNNAGGIVLAPILWHASFNFVTASPNANGFAAAFTSTAVIVWAVVILWRYSPLTFTTRRRPVRADAFERTKALPGDDLIPDSIATFTHAITIERHRREVWPWLVQMGAGARAGWYSYDLVDNGGRASARRIVPELQQVEVGTVFPALPGVNDAFTLLAFEPERFLVLGWVKGGAPIVTWAFVLADGGNGSTRLVVRARGRADYESHRQHWWQARPVLRVIHFAMERRQLLGIASRVEAVSSS